MSRLTVGELRAVLDGVDDTMEVVVVEPDDAAGIGAAEVREVAQLGGRVRIEVEYPHDYCDGCGCTW